MTRLGQLRRLVDCLLNVGRQLAEQRLRGHGITLDETGQALEVDREGDEVLLYTVVEVAFDRAAIGVAGFGQTPSRPTEGCYLILESVDNLLQVLAPASVRHRPPPLGVVGQCPALEPRGSDHDDACRGPRGTARRVARPGDHRGGPPLTECASLDRLVQVVRSSAGCTCAPDALLARQLLPGRRTRAETRWSVSRLLLGRVTCRL